MQGYPMTMFYCRTPTVKPTKRRKIEADAIEMEILRQLKETTAPCSSTSTETTDDEDFTYGKTIALTLKRLQPQQKAQAKIKIQQLLYDMEFPQPPTESVPLHPRQEPPYTHTHGYNRDSYYSF